MKFNFKRGLLFPLGCVGAIYGFGLIFPSVLEPYPQRLVLLSCIGIILAESLNLVNGFTGQFSIGHAGFMAIGAYISAFCTSYFLKNYEINPDLAFFLFTILGGAVAAAAGLIVGIPSLRLKGDYLAIVTLGFGEIIRVVLLNIEAVGGARGMYGIPKLTSFFWAGFWVFICTITMVRLVNSTHGRAFLAVREDEVAAEAMGLNTTKYKVIAFAISSFFAGVAGSLFGHNESYLNPSTFNFMKSIDVVVMVVLGGMGSISGSFVAAIIITLLPEALRPLQEITRIDFRMVLYSLTLIVLMLTKPSGLFGQSEISDTLRRWGLLKGRAK